VKTDTFSFNISPTDALTEVLDAASLFNAGAPHPVNSPVDRYLENSNKLSRIYTNAAVVPPELGAVLLLGYVSAVESYMRGIISGLVHIDEHTRNLAAPKQLSYFAASNHQPKLLPEALFDSVSFSGAWNVSGSLKEFCGVSQMGGGNYPKELRPVFEKFSAICQLRHCCVHRFGLLGAGNAHKLKVNSSLLEKPLELTTAALDDISSILEKFVLSLNSYVYRDVLERSVIRSKTITSDEAECQYRQEWTGDATQDAPRFAEYYNLFAVKSVSPVSKSMSECYVEFQKWMRKAQAAKAADANAKAKAALAKQNGATPVAPQAQVAAPVMPIPAAMPTPAPAGFAATPAPNPSPSSTLPKTGLLAKLRAFLEA
jgi:hypothetical protein